MLMFLMQVLFWAEVLTSGGGGGGVGGGGGGADPLPPKHNAHRTGLEW